MRRRWHDRNPQPLHIALVERLLEQGYRHLQPMTGERQPSQEEHFVYIAQCSDDSLYTGSTKDVAKRVAQHNTGKGAKYTLSRRPVSLQASWSFQTKSKALQAEHAIKRLSRSQKLRLIAQGTLDGQSVSEV